MTGLYAESHGIVSSDMYDPLSLKHFTLFNDTDPMWWSQAEPLWITAQRYGYKTATAMWPGSDAVNRTGTYFLPYNHLMTFQQRLGSLIQWILGNEEVKALQSLSATECLVIWVDSVWHPGSTRRRGWSLQLCTGRNQTRLVTSLALTTLQPWAVPWRRWSN